MIDRRSIGRKFDAIIKVYPVCKYEMTERYEDLIKEVRIYGVESWDIINDEDAWLVEDDTDESGIDDYHEYLRLHLDDGDTSTFRNSYVDLFRI